MTGREHQAAYKVVLLLTGNQSSGTEAFSSAWLSLPSPVWPKGLRGYCHNARGRGDVPIENAPPAPFDAIDEFLFDDADEAASWFASDDFTNGWLAPRAQLLGQPPFVISGSANIVWHAGNTPSADTVKVVTLPVRKDGMTMESFSHYWLVTHAGLALSGPGTQDRLVRLISTPADRRAFPPCAIAPFDGAGIVQFVDVAGFRAEFASSHYREVLAPDEPRFTDPARSRVMLVRENPVYAR